MELRSNAIAFDTGRIIRRVYNRSALLSRIHDWSNLDLTTDKQPYLFMSWDHVHSAVNDGVPAPGTAPAAHGSYEGSMASSSQSDASLNAATTAQTHGGTAPAQSVTAAAAAAPGAAVAPADAAGQNGRDTVSTAKVRAPAATATAAATVAPSGVATVAATSAATAAGAGDSQGAYMKAVPGFPGIKAAGLTSRAYRLLLLIRQPAWLCLMAGPILTQLREQELHRQPLRPLMHLQVPACLAVAAAGVTA